MFRSRRLPRHNVKWVYKNEGRRNREWQAIDLRKQQREEQVEKRRKAGTQPPTPKSKLEEKLESLPELIAAVKGNDGSQQLLAVTQIRKLLAIAENAPIQEVIDTGIVPRLTEFLTATQNPQLQFEAAWALTNIASGTSDHTKVVIECGAVPLLLGLLSSPSEDVRDQGIWGLGNIAGDSHQTRDFVLRSGVMAPLLASCTPAAKITTLRNAAWTLANLCRGKPQPAWDLVAPALPVLTRFLNAKDEEVLSDTCWALSHLSDDSTPLNLRINAIIEQPRVCTRLVDLLSHKNDNVKTPVLRTIGNIVTGDNQQTQKMLNAGCLPALLPLIVHSRKNIRKEVCWTISNITAGSFSQIQQVIDANLFPPLIQMMRRDNWVIRKEATWAVTNATSGGTQAQIRYLVEKGAIPAFVEILSCNDPKLVMVALDGIENILGVDEEEGKKYAELVEECGGVDNLEALQTHPNEEISSKVVKLLEKYFVPNDNAEKDLDLSPKAEQA